MSNPRVVVTDYTFPSVDAERAAAETAAAQFDAVQCKTVEDVITAVRGANVVAVQFAPFPAEAIAVLAPGAAVIRYGVGYDNIDVAAARSAGLRVGYVPDYCIEEVADHAAAAALTMLRRLPALDASLKAGEWAAVKVAKPLPPFSETKFGFFGFGQIGRAVLRRLKPFGFDFLVADPALDGAGAEAAGVTLADTPTLFAEADIVSLHAPVTARTKAFVNAALLATMKPHAIIVNTARGALIDEGALAAALTKGEIGGAALDVFEQEPLDKASPLRDAPATLLTPHAAWYSDAAIGRLQGFVAEDIGNALNGRPLRRPVPGFA